MNTSREDRIATALRLSAALHRMPAPGPDDGAVPGPVGNCGRPADDPRGCGMVDPSECAAHCDPAPGDPETLNYSGTAAMRREQLKAARRRGLRF